MVLQVLHTPRATSEDSVGAAEVEAARAATTAKRAGLNIAKDGCRRECVVEIEIPGSEKKQLMRK